MGNLGRRTFLQLTAAGGAAVAAEAGGKAVNKLIPYVVPPEPYRPGEWTLYATTCRECPAGCGMHVRNVDGRPIKCEGNPTHPVNRGGLCARGQSAVQGLYDPDRVRHPLRRTQEGGWEPRTWESAIAQVGRTLAEHRGRVLLVSDLQTGALAELMERFAGAFGRQGLLLYEPFNAEALREAHRRLFGLPVVPGIHLDQCEFVLSLSADFLESWGSPVEFAAQFAQMRSWRGNDMGRMVYVGPRQSMTAANADEFIAVPAGAEACVAMALLHTIVEQGLARADVGPIRQAVARWAKRARPVPGVPGERLNALARRFVEAKGSVALAGPANARGGQALQTALAAALLNWAAGRIGQTVDFARAHALGRAATHKEASKLFDGLTSDDVLIVHSANPAFTLPGAAEGIRRAGSVVYLGTMLDETAELATWVLPIDSPLEAWGDYEPQAGVHGLIQPTRRPLHDTKLAGDVLLALAAAAPTPTVLDGPVRKPFSWDGAAEPAPNFLAWLHHRWDGLRTRLAPERPSADFWGDALRAGGVWSEGAPVEVKLRDDAGTALATMPAAAPEPAGAGAGTLWPWPSIFLYDGRTANRGWLQEAPDPMTTIVWGSWVDLHPRKAQELGVREGDLLEVRSATGSIEVPVRLDETQDADLVAVPLGQGHTALGRNARGVGANAFALLGTTPAEGMFPTVMLRKTGRRAEPVYLSATQDQHGRRIVQWAGASELRKMAPGDGEKLILPLPEGYRPERDVYPPHEYKEHRWAMVVDLHRCIGCGACTVACYAENNIAVMGREQVGRGLEMAWLKVVPYRHPSDPRRLAWLPLMCQHCDAAPCEPVCPVYASVHNDEGLNAQVYNRCIGTRYCSNNCPYKVRRFNWLNVKHPDPLQWQLNPEVTVRSRGVMEKCTFCIQRIRHVERRARLEDRPVRDGEIAPACLQSCPTRAFVFGDLLDPNSQVSRLTRNDPRRYHVLEDLNTKPAVTYLRRIEVP